MAQIEGAETFVDSVDPGDILNATRMNNMTNGATLLNGAVIDQNDIGTRSGNTTLLAADTFLAGDSTQADSATPMKVRADILITAPLLEPTRNGSQQFASGNSGGVGSAYVLTLAPVITAYVGGLVVRFKADAANTGAVTVNVSTLGVKSVVDRAGAALTANAILSGQTCEIVYDSGNAWFVLSSATPVNSVSAATLTESARDGVYYYQSATTTHASGGGFDTYTVTLSPAPTQLITGMRFRFLVPASSSMPSKLVLNFGSGSSGSISLVKRGTLALVVNDLVAGCLADIVYDGTNFQLSNPRGFDVVSVLTHSPAASGAAAIAHGLGVLPSKVRVVLVQTNSSAQNGYTQNDEVQIEGMYDENQHPVFTYVADATNVTVIRTNGANAVMYPKGGGAGVNQATALNTPNFFWQLKVYASI